MFLRKIPALARVAALLWLLTTLLMAAPDSVVTFNEVNYHPADDGGGPEWVELHNQMSIRVYLGGWTIRGGVDYQFPEDTILEPGAKLVVSATAGTPAGALGPFTGKLDNKGEELRLHERWGRTMDKVTYGDAAPWPVEPDGGGFTLAKVQANALSDDAANWQASAENGGTPGADNFPAVTEATPRYAVLQAADWVYDPGDGAPPPAWNQLTGFNENTWSTGTAPLSTVAPATTVLPAGPSVYRIRRTFGYTGGISNARVLLTGQLKGSGVFYLNGSPQGTFTGSGDFAVTLKSETLAVGADVLAIELTPLPGGEAALDLAVTLIDGATGVKATPAPHVAGPVVVNEISYHARPTYPEPLNGVKYAENPAEWIEIYNRSAAPVDFTGWRLRGAADYDFPAGTILAAGGYLVVNQNQFSGSLSNQSATVRLRDAAGALVDEVKYYDSGRWPEAADGGGSTLELRDPNADNRTAESWAASDESAKTAWQTVTYRSTGAEPPGSNNPSTWHEFLFGMLDSGEVLIDDVSVIEDPDGTKLQLIQNGTFEGDTAGGGAAKWRLLGTHKRSRVEVIEGGGKALHLIATSEMEHSYNCASTTLLNNRAISSTRTYEISYRARWLSGSPQLNSRLYLNRAARTTILSQPTVAGTPGAPNSTRLDNAGPAFENLRHSPLVPVSSQPVRVSVAANDPDGLSAVRLLYSVAAGAWKSVPMGGDPDGTFFGIIPGQPNNSLVQLYVEAVDGKGAVSWFPKNGAASRALYRVGDGGIAAQKVRNKMRLLMTASDANNLHDVYQSVSNFRWPCTVIYNDQEVWYDAGVRLRSAPYGRQGVRAGWNILFGNDAPFRGVQKSIVIDGAFNMPKADGSGWTENSLGASVNEMLFQAVSNRAGGIAATYDDVVYFQTPRTTEGNRRAQLKMTRFGSGFLEEFLPDGDKGSLYKQELIYYPTTTVNGNAEGVKNVYNAVLDTEIKSFGTSPDSYRFNYLHENHSDKDDYSSITALGTAFYATTANLPSATAAAMDLDNWMRTYALIALIGLADTYNSGLAHNIELYARPDNGKVMLFPWDQDHAFYYGPTSSIFGGATHRLGTILQLPAYRRIYCANLLDLCNTAFTNIYLDPVINHLGTVAAKESYSATFRTYVTQRRNYVLAQVKSLYPGVAFSITSSSGNDFSVATPSAVIEGQGGIDVREIRVSRNAGPALTAAVTWLDAKRWRIIVPVPPGVSDLKFDAYDVAGAAVGTDTIKVTNTGTVSPADATNLVISEINYHPAVDGAEFVELENISRGTIDLTGVRFTAGIRFDFPSTGSVLLAPGQRLLLVGSRVAFEAKYGTGLPVTGEYSALSSLSNSGDHLTLLDLAGGVIADFSYGDSLPWPPEADGGGGHTLTRISGTTGSPADAASWRPSVAAGGSPGTSDAQALTAYPDLLSYAVIAPPAPLMADGQRTVTWTERLGADNAGIIPEVSANLQSWKTDPGDGSLLEIRSTLSSNGERTIIARLAPGTTFLRLRVTSR